MIYTLINQFPTAGGRQLAALLALLLSPLLFAIAIAIGGLIALWEGAKAVFSLFKNDIPETYRELYLTATTGVRL